MHMSNYVFKWDKSKTYGTGYNIINRRSLDVVLPDDDIARDFGQFLEADEVLRIRKVNEQEVMDKIYDRRD
jgi:hypothetical protein